LGARTPRNAFLTQNRPLNTMRVPVTLIFKVLMTQHAVTVGCTAVYCGISINLTTLCVVDKLGG
jgi:hypothetical protein